MIQWINLPAKPDTPFEQILIDWIKIYALTLKFQIGCADLDSPNQIEVDLAVK